MKTVRQIFMQGILRFGLISAVIFAVYAILIYVLEVNIFAPFFSIFSLLLTILFIVIPMVLCIRYINKQLTAPMGFGQKYLAALLTGFIGMLVYSIVFWLLMYVVDPDYMKGLQEQFMTDMYERLANAGLAEDAINQQMERIVRQLERGKDPIRNLLTSLASAAGTPAIIGLIVAASVNTRRFHEENVVIIEENQQ